MPRAVILTALPVEYLAVRRHLTDLQEEMHPQGTIYERGTFSAPSQTWEVGIVEIGAGNTGAALEVERAIAYFSPDVILFVGVAGGIKDVALGDVVAATKIYGYESGKVEGTFKPRPEIGLSDYGLVQQVRTEATKPDWLKRLSSIPSQTPKVYVAPVAAGERVIASKKTEILQFLHSHYNDVVAIEMEGFGSLSAAFANSHVQTIVVRGISDLVYPKEIISADKESGWQEISSNHASAFAFEILSKLKLSSTLTSKVTQQDEKALGRIFQKQLSQQHQLTTLQEEWVLRSEKLHMLQRALVIESGASTKFQLQKAIEYEVGELNLLVGKLNKIEESIK